MLGQPFGKVFPNEATAFHPSLPQRSRLASRVSPFGLAARKLLSGAERRMQIPTPALGKMAVAAIFARRVARSYSGKIHSLLLLLLFGLG